MLFLNLVNGSYCYSHGIGTFIWRTLTLLCFQLFGQVASRRVFLCTGILYILFGVFSKFSAVFITIPYPVLGGAIIVMFGIFFGVVLSNLEVGHIFSNKL